MLILNNVWLDTFLSLSRVQLLYVDRHRVRQWRHSQRCRCIQYTCPYVDELNEYNVVSARKDVPPKKRERERRESLYDILLLRILSFFFFLCDCVCVFGWEIYLNVELLGWLLDRSLAAHTSEKVGASQQQFHAICVQFFLHSTARSNFLIHSRVVYSYATPTRRHI